MWAYTLVSIDQDKNESEPSIPLTVTAAIDRKNKAAVKDLKAETNRQSNRIVLAWTYAEQDVVEYQVYKTVKNSPYTLWKVLGKGTSGIEDADVAASNTYKYAVRAIFADGSMSVLNEVKADF